MKYLSTRNKELRMSSAEIILKGISDEGGLFVPETFSQVSTEELSSFVGLEYKELAKRIFEKFLTDFSADEISDCVEKAYTGSFENDIPAPLVKLGDEEYMLELWHGPTCAFKDIALQILPHFMVKSAEKSGKNEKIVILTATSGDTGKAALEGFCDVPGTEIIVFYPQNGVSKMQELQMTTQKGENVSVCAVKGNFDDTQTYVKKIFTDKSVKDKLEKVGKHFSSANSINIGRLVPQIVYYFYSYVKLVSDGEIALGEKINFCVPTGNFGNILAAYYAKKMGLPIKTLICASNKNNVLTQFLNTGVYDANREFFVTESPSMDIVISSNLERLLFDISGEDDKEVLNMMNNLREHGKYEITENMKNLAKKYFYAGYCCDEEGRNRINKLFKEYSYLCDSHTAIAAEVYEQYKTATGDDAKTVIVSTASPYKFPKVVLRAVSEEIEDDDFVAAEKLKDISKTEMPKQLADLKNFAVRFKNQRERDEMQEFVLKTCGGEI